ncbi:MAG: ATP-binding protein [Acidobacteriota bacterium]
MSGTKVGSLPRHSPWRDKRTNDDPLSAFLVKLGRCSADAGDLPVPMGAVLRSSCIAAMAVVAEAGGGLRFRGVRCVDGRGWESGAQLPLAPGQGLPGRSSPGHLHDPGPGGGAWAETLQQGGYRRILVASLAGDGAFPVLVAARTSARPFPLRARRMAGRLAAALQVVARGGGRTELPATHSEAAFLLESSHRLCQAGDLPELVQVLEAILGKVVDWGAFALLPGSKSTGWDTVRSRRSLGPDRRLWFEQRVRTAARENRIPQADLEKPEKVGLPEERAALEELLIYSLAWPPRGSGLLVVWPAEGAGMDEPRRRLLAGLAQQLGPFLGRLERGKKRERARLSTLMDALPCGVILCTADGNLGRVNPEARKMLTSLSGSEPAAGASTAALGLPERDAGCARPREFCGWVDQRIYQAQWVSLAGSDGDCASAMVLADVTADEARERQALQAEKMFVLGEMLAGIAHELNNPLASVVGFSQLLLRNASDAGTRRRLEILVGESQRARRIVQNLLEVVRVQPAEQRLVDVNQLISSILDLFSYQLRLDAVEVDFCPEPRLAPVRGDRHGLQQVLVNLLTNAQHALRRASGARSLRIATDGAGGRVRIQMADTGCGIPPAYLERIFDSFFTTKEPGIGTGLGLSLAAKTVKEHGGSITARSRPGRGAVFTIDLPAASAVRERPERAASVASLGAGDGRILVVDDEESFRLLLQESLTEDGFQVSGAASGEEALSRLGADGFDLVISDLGMPGIDGKSLYRKAQEQHPEIKGRFIFVSGDLPDDATRRFLKDTGAPFLTKPIGLDELRKALGEKGRVPRGDSRGLC